ncbi:MAG: helix-turn-helix domain-containing protein [Candidatus Hydrothermia bacterium]
MTTSDKNINQEGQTVKPFNGTRGIFIPYSLIDSLHGDYYAAAIVSQLFYWMQMPGNEHMWRYQTMKELAKQLRMEYRTFFNHIKKLRKAGIITIEEHGSYKIVKLKKEIFEHMDIDEVAETVEKISTDEKFSTDEKISTDSCKNFNSTDEKISTDSCKNFNSDSPQPLEQQGKAKPLDSNKINNKINNEIDFSKLEKNTKLEAVSIPKEIEELLLIEMLRAGFPRKSLRSRIDRENLHILWEHYGSWETVIKAFQNLQKLQKEGRFLEWNWSKILRNADYLATYEPEPYFPVDRIDDLEGLRRYFAGVRPPRKYVARFIYRWVNHWKFVDMPPERTKRLIEGILKYYYSDSQPQPDPLLEDTVTVRED